MDGMDNEVILSNLQRLAEVGAPVTVRVPLIPGFNADTESISAIVAEFVSTLKGVPKRVSLLPYHTLGKAKYASLGRPYPLEGKTHQPRNDSELTEILEAQNMEVSVGS